MQESLSFGAPPDAVFYKGERLNKHRNILSGRIALFQLWNQRQMKNAASLDGPNNDIHNLPETETAGRHRLVLLS
jgi:hypothetical protein